MGLMVHDIPRIRLLLALSAQHVSTEAHGLADRWGTEIRAVVSPIGRRRRSGKSIRECYDAWREALQNMGPRWGRGEG